MAAADAPDAHRPGSPPGRPPDLESYFQPRSILPDLRARTQAEVIEEFADLFFSQELIRNRRRFIRSVLEREQVGSTGIGHGIALPHISGDFAACPAIAFGISRAGIEFFALDGKPVVFFLFAISPDVADNQKVRRILGFSLNLLKHPAYRRRILAAAGAEEIYRILTSPDPTK